MTLLKKYFAAVGMLLLCLVPIILWLGFADLADITASNASMVQAVGKGFAFIGLSLYLLLPIIILRHRWIEFAFGGLDRARRVHQFSAKLAFYFIVAHPIFLGIGRLMAGTSLGQIWAWTGLVVILGIIGMTAMITLVILSVYANINHQKWIKFHHALGWIIPIFLLHGLIADGQIVRIHPLLWYEMSLAACGFIAFYYSALLRDYASKRYVYELAESHHLEGDVTELVMKARGEMLRYRPGQYAYVSFISDLIDKEAHPFSFTTANNGPYLRFAVKALGDDTNNIAKLIPSTKALIEGPYGSFSYAITKNKQQVWIAGGVGITPFLSMARSLSKESGIKITLFYATQKLQYAAFLHELFEIKRGLYGNFDIILVDQSVSGHVDAAMIGRQIKDLTSVDYFMCGPPGMMKSLKLQLIKSGVRQRKIHAEDFT